MKSTIVLIAVLLLAPQAAPKRLTTASAVRVRSAPSTTASVVTTLSVGALMDELGRSDRPAKIGDQEDYWYRVKTPDGATGWVFGGLTRGVDPTRIDEAMLKLADERLDGRELSFTDLTDLYDALGRAAKNAATPESRGLLEMNRLVVIGRAMYRVPDGKEGEEPYKSFLAHVKNLIVYSEPGGVNLVLSDAFWKLYEQYKDSGSAESLAWAASQNQLPGECENDESCNLGAWAVTTGRYIKLYPRGAHIGESLKELDELLNSLKESGTFTTGQFEMNATELASYKGEVRQSVADVRAVVQVVDNPLKPSIISKLDELDQKAK